MKRLLGRGLTTGLRNSLKDEVRQKRFLERVEKERVANGIGLP